MLNIPHEGTSLRFVEPCLNLKELLDNDAIDSSSVESLLLSWVLRSRELCNKLMENVLIISSTSCALELIRKCEVSFLAVQINVWTICLSAKSVWKIA